MKPRSFISQKLIAANSLLLLAGCAPPEMPTKALDARLNEGPASARIVEDTVQLSTTSNGIAFRATAIIHNRSESSLFKGGHCAPDAQLKIGESWESVVSPICVGPAVLQRIQAGDSLIVPVVVYGFTASGMEPYFDRRKAHGTFRIVCGDF